MGDFFQTIIDLVISFFDSIIQFIALVGKIIGFFTTLGGVLPAPIGAMLLVLLSAMLIKAVVNR